MEPSYANAILFCFISIPYKNKQQQKQKQKRFDGNIEEMYEEKYIKSFVCNERNEYEKMIMSAVNFLCLKKKREQEMT